MTIEILNDALAEINEMRSRENLAPVSKMEKGDHHANQCPVAQTLNVGRETKERCWAARNWWRLGDILELTPPGVQLFIVAFDDGEFPEYEL